MFFDQAPLIISALALGIICFTIAAYTLKQRTVPGSVALGMVMIATAAYSIPYMLQLASTEFDRALFWYNISLPGANLLGPVWLMFSFAWTGEERKHSKQKTALLHLLLLLIPAFVCLAAWTNPLHNLYGTSIQNTLSNYGFVLEWKFGLFYWIGFVYSYLLSAIGTFILISKTVRRLRLFFHQTILILIGAVIPVFFHIAYKLGLSPITEMDLAPFAFLFTGILWGLSIFLLRFLTITQISQKSVFINMPVGMIIMDFEDRVVDMNPAAQSMLGIPLVKVISRELPSPILDQLIGVDRKTPLKEKKLILSWEIEQKERFFESSITPFHDIEQQLIGTLVLLTDITEKKLAEEALQESESRLQRAQAVGRVGNWEMDIETRMIWASDEAYAIYGLEGISQHIPVTVFNEIQLEKYRPILNEALTNLIQYRTPYDLVYEIKRKTDGENRFIHTVASVICDTHGKPEKVVGVIQDITERKLAELALSESQTLYRNLIEKQIDPVCRWLPDSTLTFVNDSYCKYFGRSEEELVGKKFFSFIPEETQISVQRVIDLFINTRDMHSFNNEEYNFDEYGNKRWIAWSFLAIKDMNGKIVEFQSVGRDITGRKEAELALQKSELQFRALFEQAAVGVAVIDSKTGLYQRINLKYCDMLGYSEDEIMATSCEKITNPEDVEPSKQMFKDLLNGTMREYSMEKRYLHKDGHQVWVFMNIAAMWAVGEEPTSMIMVVQDISERKTAEAAMRESDAKMRAITESAQDAIVMMDPGGKISYWNPAAETILGYTAGEAIGRHLHSLIATERYHEMINGAFPSFTQTGQGKALGKSHEMEARRKDGTEIPIRLSLSNFQMNGLWYAVGIISDISDMKKATRELQEQYQFANQIINTMGQGLTVTDSDGRFEFINPAYGRMFGYDSDSLIGKRPQDITLPVDHDILTRERNNRKAGLKTSYENRLICADGKIADVLITSVPRESDGKYAGAIAVITDLSEQKRYQKIQGVIYKIAQAMVAKSGINELYFAIHTILKELLPVENFFIALYDEETDLISYPYVVDQYDPPPAPRKPGRGLTEYVLRIGKPVLVTPEAFDVLVARGEVESVGTESVDWVGSPLIVDGKIIGVMAMQSYIENIRFSLDDMRLLEFVSNQVGLAIVKKRGEEMQMHQSTHDRLTGLYNRQYYEIEIARLQQSRRFPVSILMMDVDNLKMVNDKLGHTAGDELLKTVARILNCSFRPEDMVSRVGGDEFVAVLPETDAISAGLVVKRLLKSFELHNRDSKPYQVVSVSIGCSTGDQNSLLTEVFKEADEAMYIQKEEKKNSINA